MSIRTDMAAESFSQAGGAEKLQGVKVKNKVIENARLEVTDITIETQEAAEKLGRPVGRYITLTATDSTFDMYSDSFRERAEVIAKAIGELCGGCERFLAVGLGNYALTSDAVGPLTAEKIFATRHIKSLAKEIDTDDLGEVTVIQTGVLVNVLRVKQIWHTEDLVNTCKSLQICSTCYYEVDRTGLSQLDRFLRGTQKLIWEDLDFILIS
jgi:spore protease